MSKSTINYQADEFIRQTAPNPKHIASRKKISQLYDMGILVHPKKNEPDYREHLLRQCLEQYPDEYAICRAMHPIVAGDITLNEYLQSKTKEI